MVLRELIKSLEIVEAKGNLDREITGIAYHSREVKPGYIFVGISGFKTDGHRFIPEALARGAAAVVVEKKIDEFPGTVIEVTNTRQSLAALAAHFYHYPSSRLKVVGVTGTNGKTTTTYLIEGILRSAGFKVGLMGTVVYRMEEEKMVAQRTTPESLDIEQFLSQLVNRGVHYAVMEVSSHALELERVSQINFDVGVFTNLTRDHLDFHGDFERYFAAKQKLFRALEKPGNKKDSCLAVVNIDDPYGERIARESRVKVVTFGMEKEALIQAEDIQLHSQGINFRLKYSREETDLNLKLLGRYNVYNALAAAAVGISQNLPWKVIKSGLEKVVRIPGRFEPVEGKQKFQVIVDYAHTPDALYHVLQTIRELEPRQLITVFGCGGERDRTKRPLMGEVAVKMSDLVVITSDNPRGEDPYQIIEEIKSGIAPNRVEGKDYVIIPEREEAIHYALDRAEEGDWVLIAGKGHENYQIIGDCAIPFSDREVAQKILADMGF